MSTPLALVAVILLIGTAGNTQAQTTSKDDEIRQLRERLEQIEGKLANAQAGGDTRGGLRLPGIDTALHIYGYAEAHVIHDVGASGPNDLFTDLSLQPLDKDQPQRGKTRFTAETSRLGFETSTPTMLGAFMTRVEADFYSYGAGNRNHLRLRHAYGEVAGFLIGQTWSTFMDLDDLPETVDFNVPPGATFRRHVPPALFLIALTLMIAAVARPAAVHSRVARASGRASRTQASSPASSTSSVRRGPSGSDSRCRVSRRCDSPRSVVSSGR